MSRLKRGTLNSSGASQNPVVASIVYSLTRSDPSVCRLSARRPNHSQAVTIRATPIHSTSEETTSPWPNRSQDRCRDSSSGSC